MTLVRKTVSITTSDPEDVEALWAEMTTWTQKHNTSLSAVILEVFSRVLAGEIKIASRINKTGDKMTYDEFKTRMAGAEALRRHSTGIEPEFWAGYMRGLRWSYHGENFRATDHNEERTSQALGHGYQVGQKGLSIDEAIKEATNAG